MNFEDYEATTDRTWQKHDGAREELANAAMGLAGEAGELVDLMKKSLFHGKPAAKRDIESEAGDVLYYLVRICRCAGTSLARVATANAAKLQKRYPAGFVKGGGHRFSDCKDQECPDTVHLPEERVPGRLPLVNMEKPEPPLKVGQRVRLGKLKVGEWFWLHFRQLRVEGYAGDGRIRCWCPEDDGMPSLGPDTFVHVAELKRGDQ